FITPAAVRPTACGLLWGRL
ncbi:hypothetical protein MIMGU_mgv1a0139232mg, partial [Erythranthe guttata]